MHARTSPHKTLPRWTTDGESQFHSFAFSRCCRMKHPYVVTLSERRNKALTEKNKQAKLNYKKDEKKRTRIEIKRTDDIDKP